MGASQRHNWEICPTSMLYTAATGMRHCRIYCGVSHTFQPVAAARISLTDGLVKDLNVQGLSVDDAARQLSEVLVTNVFRYAVIGAAQKRIVVGGASVSGCIKYVYLRTKDIETESC